MPDSPTGPEMIGERYHEHGARRAIRSFVAALKHLPLETVAQLLSDLNRQVEPIVKAGSR